MPAILFDPSRSLKNVQDLTHPPESQTIPAWGSLFRLFFRSRPGTLVVMFLSLVVNVAAKIVVAGSFGVALDAIARHDRALLWHQLWLFTVAALAQPLSTTTANYTRGILGMVVGNQLREDFHRRLLDAPLRIHDLQHPGDLQTRLSGDIAVAETVGFGADEPPNSPQPVQKNAEALAAVSILYVIDTFIHVPLLIMFHAITNGRSGNSQSTFIRVQSSVYTTGFPFTFGSALDRSRTIVNISANYAGIRSRNVLGHRRPRLTLEYQANHRLFVERT